MLLHFFLSMVRFVEFGLPLSNDQLSDVFFRHKCGGSFFQLPSSVLGQVSGGSYKGDAQYSGWKASSVGGLNCHTMCICIWSFRAHDLPEAAS